MSDDYNPFVPSENVVLLCIQAISDESIEHQLKGIPDSLDMYILQSLMMQPERADKACSDLEALSTAFKTEFDKSRPQGESDEDYLVAHVQGIVPFLRKKSDTFEGFYQTLSQEYEELPRTVEAYRNSLQIEPIVEILTQSFDGLMGTFRNRVNYDQREQEVREMVLIEDEMFVPEFREELDKRFATSDSRADYFNFYRALAGELFTWGVANPTSREMAGWHYVADEGKLLLRIVETERDREVLARKARPPRVRAVIIEEY